MRAIRSCSVMRRPKTSVLLRLRLARKDLSDWISRPLVSAARYSSMAAGPLHDFDPGIPLLLHQIEIQQRAVRLDQAAGKKETHQFHSARPGDARDGAVGGAEIDTDAGGVHIRGQAGRHLATIRVMSSYCSRGLNCVTSSTMEAARACEGSSRCRRRASIRRCSPNSSSAR